MIFRGKVIHEDSIVSRRVRAAKLRLETLKSSTSLCANDFYDSEKYECSLFSDLFHCGTLDDMRQFYALFDRFRRSEPKQDYKFSRIMAVKGDWSSPERNPQLTDFLDLHFEFLIELIPVVSAQTLVTALDDSLLYIASYKDFPVGYFIFIDLLLSQKKIPASEVVRLLSCMATLSIKGDQAFSHCLKLINKLIESGGLDINSLYNLFKDIFFKRSIIIASYESPRDLVASIDFNLVLDVLIKLDEQAGADLEFISQTAKILKKIIINDDRFNQYLLAVSHFPSEKARMIHETLFRTYGGHDFWQTPAISKFYFRLWEIVGPSIDIESKKELAYVLSSGFSVEVNRALNEFIGVDEGSRKKIIAHVYDALNANPRGFIYRSRILVQINIGSKSIKELIFEHMRENISPDEKIRLFQGVIDNFTGRVSSAVARGVAAGASKNASHIDPMIIFLTKFFSASRGPTGSSLNSGTLRKVHAELLSLKGVRSEYFVSLLLGSGGVFASRGEVAADRSLADLGDAYVALDVRP